MTTEAYREAAESQAIAFLTDITKIQVQPSHDHDP